MTGTACTVCDVLFHSENLLSIKRTQLIVKNLRDSVPKRTGFLVGNFQSHYQVHNKYGQCKHHDVLGQENIWKDNSEENHTNQAIHLILHCMLEVSSLSWNWERSQSDIGLVDCSLSVRVCSYVAVRLLSGGITETWPSRKARSSIFEAAHPSLCSMACKPYEGDSGTGNHTKLHTCSIRHRTI